MFAQIQYLLHQDWLRTQEGRFLALLGWWLLIDVVVALGILADAAFRRRR